MNETLVKIGQRAQAAADQVALLDTATKNQALGAMADALLAHQADIIAANQADLAQATDMPKKIGRAHV